MVKPINMVLRIQAMIKGKNIESYAMTFSTSMDLG